MLIFALYVLKALEYYDAKANQKTSLPNVICMITGKCRGICFKPFKSQVKKIFIAYLFVLNIIFFWKHLGKGPQKEYYEKIIASKKWTSVRIKTLWLTAEDYPKLLGNTTEKI